MEFTLEGFLKDLGFRVAAAAGAAGVFATLAYLGDFLEIELLQSPGGILTVITIGAVLVLFPLIGSLYLTDRI